MDLKIQSADELLEKRQYNAAAEIYSDCIKQLQSADPGEQKVEILSKRATCYFKQVGHCHYQ